MLITDRRCATERSCLFCACAKTTKSALCYSHSHSYRSNSSLYIRDPDGQPGSADPLSLVNSRPASSPGEPFSLPLLFIGLVVFLGVCAASDGGQCATGAADVHKNSSLESSNKFIQLIASKVHRIHSIPFSSIQTRTAGSSTAPVKAIEFVT